MTCAHARASTSLAPEVRSVNYVNGVQWNETNVNGDTCEDILTTTGFERNKCELVGRGVKLAVLILSQVDGVTDTLQVTPAG